jgi:hypothetical protein
LEREEAKVGFKMNEQKTKYMIADRNDRTIHDVGLNVAIGDKHFEVVKEFVHLGSLMTPTNDVSLENNEESKLQIGASSVCANICSRAIFERKVLRTICGKKIENRVYRKRHNHELDREFNSPNALNVTKTNILRHAGDMT